MVSLESATAAGPQWSLSTATDELVLQHWTADDICIPNHQFQLGQLDGIDLLPMMVDAPLLDLGNDPLWGES